MANKEKFFKRHSIAFLSSTGLAAIFTVLALIFGGLSCIAPGYYYANFAWITVMSIVMFIFIVAAVCIPIFFKDKKIYKWMMIVQTVLLVASTFMAGFSIMLTFTDSRTLMIMGDVWFSELARGKPIPQAAMNNTASSMVFFLLAAIALVVAAFLNPLKRNELAETKSV